MLKELPVGRIVSHRTDFIVVQGDRVSPITGEIAYTEIARFVLRAHAELFAKQITCYHVAIINPEYKPYDAPIIFNGQAVTFR